MSRGYNVQMAQHGRSAREIQEEIDAAHRGFTRKRNPKRYLAQYQSLVNLGYHFIPLVTNMT